MLSPIRWAVVALLATAAAPALADHDGRPHDASGGPCAYEGYDAIRMQAPDGGCAGIPARGASDAAAMSPARGAEEPGGGAGEPQRGGEAPVDPFQARIWTGP